MGSCSSSGKGTGKVTTYTGEDNISVTSTEINNIIKDILDLSNKDIKKIEGFVDSYDYTPRILYRDYINNPEYSELKKLNDTYDDATKTIQVQKPSASIDYLLDNMPPDYTKPYVSNGRQMTNMSDDSEKFLKIRTGPIPIVNRNRASKALYDTLKNSVNTTTRYKDGKHTKYAMTRIPKDAPKFLREASAIILMERLKNKTK